MGNAARYKKRFEPWLVLLLLPGCAQLAGIEDTSGDGRLGLSVGVERISIGSTVIRSAQDLSANTATYLIADPVDPAIVTPFTATESTPGLWTADVFDGTPPVLFDLPDVPGPPFERLLALPNKNLLVGFDQLEHPDAVPSAPTDTIAVTATLDVAQSVETYELLVIGTWTTIGLAAPAAGTTTLAPPAFEIQAMSSLTGRPHERITAADTVLLLRRNGLTLTGAVTVAPFEQMVTNPVMGAFGPLPADRTLAQPINPTVAAQRLSVARPTIMTGPTFGFDVHAAPGAEVGSNAGVRLVSGTVMMADTMISAAYPNPFAQQGWPAVLSYTAAGSRTLTPEGQTLPVTLSAGLQQLVADPAVGEALDFPAPVPELVSLDGTSLSLDNATLAQPIAPVTVAIEVGTADVYVVELRELVPNATNDALVPQRTLMAVGVEPTLSLPPEVFEIGKTYSLRVQTITGLFPNLADGDLNARALPMATAFVDTGVFRVAQ